MAKRGRPRGSVVRLLDDRGRFEIAAWLAFSEMGLDPYPAAYLTHFLITTEGPITTESIDGVLLKSSTARGPASVIGHADRIRRKAPEAIARADERERAWLVASSGSIRALVKFAAEGNASGIATTLDLLREAGWTEVLSRLVLRLDAALRSNFPPSDGPLGRAAKRLLRDAKKSDA